MSLELLLSLIGGGGLVGLLMLLWKIRSTKATNRPRLEIFRRIDKSGNPEVWLTNQGTAPAVITNFALEIDNQEDLSGETADSYMQALTTLDINSRVEAFITGPGKVIAPGTEICLLNFIPEDIAGRQNEVANKLSRLKFKFEYKSELGESLTIKR